MNNLTRLIDNIKNKKAKVSAFIYNIKCDQRVIPDSFYSVAFDDVFKMIEGLENKFCGNMLWEYMNRHVKDTDFLEGIPVNITDSKDYLKTTIDFGFVDNIDESMSFNFIILGYKDNGKWRPIYSKVFGMESIVAVKKISISIDIPKNTEEFNKILEYNPHPEALYYHMHHDNLDLIRQASNTIMGDYTALTNYNK